MDSIQKNSQPSKTWRIRALEYALTETIRETNTMDDKVRADLCQGLAELSAEVVEQSASSVAEEWQKEVNGEIMVNGESFMICAESGASGPMDELQSLLQRQTEVARAVADQEQSSWKMLNMITHLTKVIADQEQMILSLQQERTGAERMAAEISVDLRTQYVEISKLKQRYDSAEEQLETVQETVQSLQDEMKFKDKLLADKDATIQELKQRPAKSEQQNLQNKNKKHDGANGIAQVQHDRENRLAEMRSILSRSKKRETDAPLRAKPSSRIEALRAARDSRLQEIRGMMQNSPTTTSPKQTKLMANTVRYDNIVREHSVSSTSEESMSDVSSLGSFSDNNHEERHRLFEALVRQRRQLREMP